MGYVKIITAILIWSSLGIFVRKIGLPNPRIVFYSAIFAVIAQAALVLAKGTMREASQHGKGNKSSILLILVPVFFLANTLLFYYAFKHTTIANAVLTHYTAPVFVALLAPVFLREEVLKTAWAAIVISSIGLWLILGMPVSGELFDLSGRESRGIAAGACSGLAYALLILIIRAIASRYSSLFIVFFQNLVVAVLILPFMTSFQIEMHHLPYFVTLGVVHSTAAPLLYVQGFRQVKANEAAILGYFEPAGAIVLAWIVLHEVPEILAVLGGALILLSGYLVVRESG